MATSRGRASVDALFATAPDKLMRVLRGAGRAGGAVIADEARERANSEEVREDIRVRTKAAQDRVIVTIDVKPGWGRTLGIWAEYGTDPHFISVDPNFSGGRTARRVNYLDREAAKVGGSGPGATLVINGKPVGATVFHPGARPEPFLRPALDLKERDAIAEAQRFLNARVSRRGIDTAGTGGNDE